MSDPYASAPFLSVPAAAEKARQSAPEHRYVDVGLLGTGGMGEVRAVHDAALGRQVARKSPRADVPGATEALAQEAAVTATLEHPGIVAVYDVGEDADGTPWYTMRLIRGRSLRAVIDDTPTLAERMALLRPVLATIEAVAYAHARGIVHCDLKTANILMGEHGEVQVVDWGLAGPSPNPASGGTPATMAPEQICGDATTPESDVWGLGLVLREVLTGQPSRPGISASDPLPGVRSDLRAIVRRCLQPKPCDRYANAGAMAKDLARFLDGQLVDAHRYTVMELIGRVVSQHRLAVSVALVATLALVLVGTTAAVRVVSEQRAAVAAEAVAVQALKTSDQHLAQALLLAARTAASKGMRPEAEVLAAGVLGLEPSAVARGILAASGASPPPTHRATPLAPCAGTRHQTRLGTVCATGDSLVLPGPAGITVPIAAEDIASAGQHLIVTVHGNMAVVLDPVTGEEVRRISDLLSTVGVASGGAFAWHAAGKHLTKLDPELGQRTLYDACGAGVVVAGITELTDGSLAVICGQQQVLHLTSPTQPGQSLPFDLRDPQATVRVLASGPDGVVALGTDRGHVRVVQATGQRFETQLASPVTHLAWTIDGRRLVVSVSGGSPVILDSASGAVLGRLPVQDRRLAGMHAPSLVTVEHRGGRQWDVGPMVPTTIGAGAGITGLLVGVDDDVLVTRGDGAVDRYDLLTGALIAHKRWSDRPLKGITAVPDGYAVVGVEGGVHRLSADLSSDVQLADVPGRRLLTVGEDLLVLRYGGPGSRIFADGASETLSELNGPTWFDGGTSPDGTRAAVLAEDGVLWRVGASGPPQHGGDFPLASAVDVGDSGVVVLAEPDALVFVSEDGAVRRQARQPDTLLDIALSPGERWVALAGLNGVVTVRETQSGEVVAVLDGHSERVAVVVWDSDQRLFSGSWDGTVRLWDLSRQDLPADALLADLSATWDLDVAGALHALDP